MGRRGALVSLIALAVAALGVLAPVGARAASPPAITGVDPPSGPIGGGTLVTITGVAFDGATEVDFGTTSASYTVVDGSTINAVSPAGTSGTVDVRVTTPDGTSAVSNSDHFTYQEEPVVDALDPISGPLGGGIQVTISGSNFIGTTDVKFGVKSVDPDSFTVDPTGTEINAISPDITEIGPVGVTVTTPSGTSGGATFTYQDGPAITELDPPSGPIAGGTTVVIVGSSFIGATKVEFGDVTFGPSSFTVGGDPGEDPQTITLDSPAVAATGDVDVIVTTPSGTSTAATFVYQGAPKVTSVSPKAGPKKGGTSVTVKGSNLVGASVVMFGSAAGTSIAVVSATELTVVSPEGSAGTVDVQVTTPSGTSAKSSDDHFTYQAKPTVTSLSPSSGSPFGGTSVTIAGTGFLTASAVMFGDTAAISFNIKSSTKIVAVSPAGTGTVDVTVTTSSGTSDTSSKDDFTFTNATPSGGVGTGGGGTAPRAEPLVAMLLVLLSAAGLLAVRIRYRRA
jgi:large repetitive protein